jgi:hypothetical protein
MYRHSQSAFEGPPDAPYYLGLLEALAVKFNFWYICQHGNRAQERAMRDDLPEDAAITIHLDIELRADEGKRLLSKRAHTVHGQVGDSPPLTHAYEFGRTTEVTVREAVDNLLGG